MFLIGPPGPLRRAIAMQYLVSNRSLMIPVSNQGWGEQDLLGQDSLGLDVFLIGPPRPLRRAIAMQYLVSNRSLMIPVSNQGWGGTGLVGTGLTGTGHVSYWTTWTFTQSYCHAVLGEYQISNDTSI